MNKRLTIDFIYGLIFAVAGLIIILLTSNIPVPGNLTEPGPRIFPYISGIGILLCGVGMTLTKSIQQEKKAPVKGGKKRLVIISIALVLYYAALSLVGFLVATPFACFAFIKILNGNEKVNTIFATVLSLVVTIGLYFLFVEAFKIYLPVGMIFG